MPEAGPIVAFAYILYTYIVGSLYRKHPIALATILSVLLAEMYLPSGEDAMWDFPMVPPLSKAQWSAITIIFFIYLRKRKQLMQVRPLLGLELLPLVLCLGWIVTWKTNPEPLVYGTLSSEYPEIEETILPAVKLYDIISETIRESLHMVIPFLIGRAAFQTKDDLKTLCTTIIAGGIIYIPLMFIDMRLGPIVHSTVYGYFPHDLSQTLRWGGFRPQGFMLHGLILARYQLIAFVCAAALYNGGFKKIWKLGATTAIRVLMVLVVFCKSVGVVVFLAFFAPLLFLTSIKTQARTALFIGLLVLTYPYVRAFKILDIDKVVNLVAKYSPERAQSLGYRFRNENELSERARKKLWFGWGGYARGHIWDEGLGINLTTVDGYWVGRFSTTGVLGLIAPFALMLFPVIRVVRNYKKLPNKSDQRMLIAFSMVPLIYATECIPNSIFMTLPFITAGALWQIFSNMTDPKKIAADKYLRQYGGHQPPYPPPAYPPPIYPPPHGGATAMSA